MDDVAVPHSHRRSASTSPEVLAWRWLAAALAIVGAVVLAAMVITWPARPHVSGSELQGQLVRATVQSTAPSACGSDGSCLTRVVARITSGPDRGHITSLDLTPGPTEPELRAGDHIRLARSVQTGGSVLYEFADVDRGQPLVLLAAIFVAAALLIGRWRGLAAVIGLIFAGAILVLYVVPALVDGTAPLLVVLIAGSAVTLVVLPIAHGFSTTTGVAVIGTLLGMSLAAALAAVMVHSLHITGLSSEEFAVLRLQGSHSTVTGLFLAGAVIGALGVLNDVTVTQASAVRELAAEEADRRVLFVAAMRIGRDHIASTTYSLVLAYAGSSLPLLLLFALAHESAVDSLTSDALAPALASGLIGGTALVLVVPLTTAAAAGLTRPRTRTNHRATPQLAQDAWVCCTNGVYRVNGVSGGFHQ